MIMIAGGNHTYANSCQKSLILSTAAFCAVSATMAQLLKTNYANFYSCNIPVFETLRTSLQESIGYVPTQLLYILVVAALTILFVLLAYWLACLVRAVLRSKREVTKV